MDKNTSTKLITDLVTLLRDLCSGYIEFDNSIMITGHIYVTIDSGKHNEYVVNEKILKSNEDGVSFQSKSFHSHHAALPENRENDNLNVSKFSVQRSIDIEACPIKVSSNFSILNKEDSSSSIIDDSESLQNSPKNETKEIKALSQPIDVNTETKGIAEIPCIVKEPVSSNPEQISSEIFNNELKIQTKYSRLKKPITGDKQYSCDKCSKSFSRNCHLQRHKATHMKYKPHKCVTCGMGFREKYNLQTHERTHTKEKPFKCTTCESAFALKADLKVHMRRHTGERPYKCLVCEKTFADPSNLRRHKKIHVAQQSLSGSFTTISDDLHLENTTTGNKTVGLGESDTTIKQEVDQHAKSIISTTETSKRVARKKDWKRTDLFAGQTKPYKCDICGKEFSQSCDLKCHIRIHTGERPFMCEVCGKGFAQKTNLIQHNRIHSGERPFSCLVCSKKFAVSSSLIKHMRTHTGEKPYICEICGADFRVSSHLHRHRRGKHGDIYLKKTDQVVKRENNINIRDSLVSDSFITNDIKVDSIEEQNTDNNQDANLLRIAKCLANFNKKRAESIADETKRVNFVLNTVKKANYSADTSKDESDLDIKSYKMINEQVNIEDYDSFPSGKLDATVTLKRDYIDYIEKVTHGISNPSDIDSDIKESQNKLSTKPPIF